MADVDLKMPPYAEIGSAQPIHALMVAAFRQAKAGDRLVVDFQAVERVDSSFGQLLVAFLAEARSRGLAVVLKDGDPFALLSEALSCTHLCQRITGLLDEMRIPHGPGAHP